MFESSSLARDVPRKTAQNKATYIGYITASQETRQENLNIFTINRLMGQGK